MSLALRTKVLGAALILAGFLIGSVARAQPSRRWVEVVVIGSEDDAHTLDRSLRELLTRLEIDLDYRHVDHLNEASFAVPSDAPPLTIVAVDLDADPVTVTFRDARTGKPLGKREIARNKAPNVTVETVAQIVQVGVEDITATAAALPPAPMTPPPPQPETKPEPPSQPIGTFAPPSKTATPQEVAPRTREKARHAPWGFDFGAFADGNYVASNTGLVVGGGALATFALWRGQWRPALTLSGSYHASFDASDAFVDEHVKLLSLRAVPTVQLAGTRAWSIDVGAGVGADIFFTSQSSASVPSQFLREGRTDADPIVLANATLHVSVASGSDLFLSFALPVDLAPHRYLDDIGGSVQTVFLPARVRPMLAFGFELTGIGKAAYGAPDLNGAEK